MSNLVSGVKSIVLTSDDPEQLAHFYRDTLQIPLEKEQHRGTDAHWACQYGALHIAIHPRAGFWLEADACNGAGTVVSFTVENLEALLSHLELLHVRVIQTRNVGPMKFVAFRDPDGRYVCCGTPWPGARHA
jgi:catechol 2,3-dioxygenase-like lactoylglutathione lyase family enzyme